MVREPQHVPVKTTNEARQGVTGHNVRYVLTFGLLAVIVGFAAAFMSSDGPGLPALAEFNVVYLYLDRLQAWLRGERPGEPDQKLLAAE